ncbi:MAG: hypothetical protein ACRDKT_17130 [Actinomycetota bacterium]
MTEQAVVEQPVTDVRSRRRGRPIAGAIAGLLLGVFVAADLMMFEIRPLDNISVIGIPVAGLVIGFLLGLWAPFGGRSAPVAPNERNG